MNKIVGNNLKMLRKSKNMSQEQVADHLNISQSAYARMERGDSASWANHFRNICELFDRAPEELVKKELGLNSNESLFDTERQTERALINVYRKIIKQYESQIKDLKKIIKYLNKDKKQN
ncbi:helix-turn-helix transcriptional regulator [Flavobacterium phragmitis]|uniref:Transcriptional regulator, contains XRE-family HTH domain n=1 Tax=Flavobacterium phragmitis TaxID=739143 RepID=A0A1I1S200_9FLAO|nr:helix-turn-helix transcriptional regulator [Flavobacterium phragmitis]SFD40624.1 Transcriptional regulator, contains XRE-family HTH domain [Flavobacterium phragmitis]